mgnify:CR=1 FL=1
MKSVVSFLLICTICISIFGCSKKDTTAQNPVENVAQTSDLSANLGYIVVTNYFNNKTHTVY